MEWRALTRSSAGTSCDVSNACFAAFAISSESEVAMFEERVKMGSAISARYFIVRRSKLTLGGATLCSSGQLQGI